MHPIKRRDSDQIIPSQAVLHPAWLAAVGVLVLNDHLLKSSELVGFVTGKLSDVAGLFFFPVLLAALCRVRTKRGLVLSGVATAVVFSAINLSAAAAAQFDALISTVVGFHTTVDPTDLIALVAIPAGLRFFAPMMRAETAPSRTKRRLQLVALLAGGAASVATSPPPCEGLECEEMDAAHVTLLNKTNELQTLRVRVLRPGVVFDCDTVRERPNDFFYDAIFDEPETWLLQSGQERGLTFSDIDDSEDSPCVAVLVHSDTMPDILIFFDERELSAKMFAFDPEIPANVPADRQTVILEADYSAADPAQMHEWRERTACGGRADLCDPQLLEPLATVPDGTRYYWTSQHSSPLHHLRSEREPTPTQPAHCAPARSKTVDWEAAFDGELSFSFVEGPDGCHTLQLTETRSWSICAPVEALGLLIEAGEQATVSATPHTDEQWDAVEITVIDRSPTLRRAAIWLVRGSAAPAPIDFGPVIVPADECSSEEIACGEVARLGKLESTQSDLSLNVGESSGDEAPYKVHLTHAQHYLVADQHCSANTQSGYVDTLSYFEAVVVRED